MFNARRLVRKISTVMAATALAAAAVSCTPAQTETTTTPQPDPKQVAPTTEDIALEGFEDVKLTGVRFVPEGFGFPGMARVVPKKPVPLDKQRKAQAAAKPDKKALETKILATMLWDATRDLQDEAQAKALREETRTLLRDTRAAMGAEFDDILSQMLFTAEVWAGDEAGALAVGTDLLTRYPDSASAKALAPWVAYYHLRAWNTAEAAKIVVGWDLGALDPNSDYQRAYVMAWVAFRQGEQDKARDAIVWAARNWKSRATQQAIERDFILMLARASTPLDQAATILAEISGGAADVQYIWLYRLYEGYELAGYNELAAAALDKALQVLGDQVPPDNRVVILQRQSNNYLIAHQPEKAADALIAAYKAVAPCADKCTGKDAEIAEQTKRLAPHFHTTFTTTQDPAYYGPAKKLYEFYVGLNQPDAATIKGYLSQLDETKERMVPNSGKHDKATMEWSTTVRNQAAKACYEKVLQGQPELKGSVTLMLDIAASGEVSGAQTEPAAGAEGIAAVAGCLQERARAWRFPARTKPGKTVMSRSYLFEPEAAAQPQAKLQ